MTCRIPQSVVFTTVVLAEQKDANQYQPERDAFGEMWEGSKREASVVVRDTLMCDST